MEATIAQSPGLMSTLKEATAELHRHAESRLFQKSLLTGDASPATYRAYLVELHAIHTALEEALLDWRCRMPELVAVFGDDQRRAADLEADIEFLGRKAGLAVPAERATPTAGRLALVEYIDAHAATDLFATLGSFYVLEGSMNGNRFLARALAKAWSIEDRSGLCYLDPYGEQQRDNWQRFRAAMNDLDVTPEQIESAVRAACLTFDAIANISDEVQARATGTSAGVA